MKTLLTFGLLLTLITSSYCDVIYERAPQGSSYIGDGGGGMNIIFLPEPITVGVTFSGAISTSYTELGCLYRDSITDSIKVKRVEYYPNKSGDWIQEYNVVWVKASCSGNTDITVLLNSPWYRERIDRITTIYDTVTRVDTINTITFLDTCGVSINTLKEISGYEIQGDYIVLSDYYNNIDIYNTKGIKVQSTTHNNEIYIGSLNRGVYVLVTEEGYIKFVW